MTRPNNPTPPGAAIRRLRHEHGITQEALAFKANVTIAALSRIERGVTNPRWNTIEAVVGALEITLQDFARAVERQLSGAAGLAASVGGVLSSE